MSRKSSKSVSELISPVMSLALMHCVPTYLPCIYLAVFNLFISNFTQPKFVNKTTKQQQKNSYKHNEKFITKKKSYE